MIVSEPMYMDTLEDLQDGLSLLQPYTSHSSKRLSGRRRSSVLRRMSVGSTTHSVELNITEDYEQPDENVVVEDDEEATEKPNLRDFKPITVLGRGAYGKVILVKHSKSGLLFAQKELRKASIIVNKHFERTMAERHILTKISNHPNIVKLFYALHDDEKVYLMLQYVPGGELFMHLSKENFLTEKTAAFYAAQMAAALKHLHDLGVVYRDLKPENCLIDAQGFLVLTDFGLSKASADSTESHDFCHSIIGTPEYMAPEVLKGENYSYCVDWWSLGAVVYDMLCGKPPFTGNNHKAISDRIIKDKVKYPFYFSADCKDLLNKLLNKNLKKRISDARYTELQKHRFFRDVDWVALNKRDTAKVSPPIIPVITDPELAENFDPEFTGMAISMKKESSAQEDQRLFDGFSYKASESFLDRFLK